MKAKVKQETTAAYFVMKDGYGFEPLCVMREMSWPDEPAGDVILKRKLDEYSCRTLNLGNDPDVLRALGRALIEMAGAPKGVAAPAKPPEPHEKPKQARTLGGRKAWKVDVNKRERRCPIPHEKPITCTVNAKRYWSKYHKVTPPIRAALREGGLVAVRLNLEGLDESSARSKLYHCGRRSNRYEYRNEAPKSVRVKTRIVYDTDPEYDQKVGKGHTYMLGWAD